MTVKILISYYFKKNFEGKHIFTYYMVQKKSR